MKEIVVIATLCAPTTEGGRFRRTAIFDKDTPVTEIMHWAKSITGSAVLDSVEISEPALLNH